MSSARPSFGLKVSRAGFVDGICPAFGLFLLIVLVLYRGWKSVLPAIQIGYRYEFVLTPNIYSQPTLEVKRFLQGGGIFLL
ncbi:MAG TPA: hypothetical protein VLA93_09760 [Pyrinomonadaceae bacterium]|nr:hypothetical protein [Pyrinomonadaceae bacterium]